MVKPRRAFGPEFKAQAAEIDTELGWSVAKVAGGLGLCEGPSRGRLSARRRTRSEGSDSRWGATS